MGRLAIFPIVLVLAALGSGQVAQRTPQPKSPPIADANDWMRVPTPVSSPDPVPPYIRSQRDLAFDSGIGAPQPLPGYDMAVGGETLAGPELPDHPRRAIMIATFMNYRSVWSASKRSVYTELTFHTRHVFQDILGHALADTDVIVIVPGGTVETPSGQVFSYMVQPKRYSMKPKGTYLLVLGYTVDGDFYNELTSWDLSDGTIKANNATEAARQKLGESTLIDLSQDQVVRLLGERFSR